jgi:hypothetical protein
MGYGRFRSLFWAIAVLIAIAFTWFIGNLLYALLWRVVGDLGFPGAEARMIAYLAAHLLPFLLILLAGWILWWAIRHQIALAEASREKSLLSPARYSDKEATLIDTIWWIADNSAWGRWQTAQQNNAEKRKGKIG